MKAECTWPDNDVMIILEGTHLVLHKHPTDKDIWIHGAVDQGTIGLTAVEAQLFALELLAKAYEAEQISLEYSQHGSKAV